MWHMAPGTRHLARRPRHLALGTRHLAPGTWHVAPGTWHFFAAALVVVSMLAGCTSSDSGDGRTPVRIFLMFLSTREAEYFKWVEQTYEARNPEVDVQIMHFPGSSLKDFEVKLRLMFASGQAPDVIPVAEAVAADFARKKLLDPCPPYIEEMVVQNSVNDLVRESAYVDGTCYGMANAGVWTVMFYNKKMFREVGLDPDRPPETWDELLDHAERLTVRDADGEPTRAGFFIRKTGFKPGIAGKWLTFLYSAGGRPFSTDGRRSTINSPEGREALGFYKEILDRRIDSIEIDGDEQGFGQEKVAIFFREAYMMRFLDEHYPQVEYGVAPIPKKARSMSDGASYVTTVNADSPNKEEAWRFIAFLMQDEAYERLVRSGGAMPATKSVASLPRYAEDPMIRTFLDQPVAPTNTDRGMDRALETLGAYIERFCYGHLTIDETLERAEDEINAILDRLNRDRSVP